ncbi:hypothetical protein [uncultured Methanobrevibacter sp.]|jgi:hypothetical protein|uniref:hypothetical protein n=1 Tax=uncultured Methanobrevibacter sp. TaxID=253161 RepID=UPI0025EE6267|nr:hypothetical protein [uncultured Methanobrevibacter sp.]
MVDSFCGGIKASNYRHVQRIYELEDISEYEKNRYLKDLKKNNPEIYSEVIELKNRLEKDIVNVKEALLFGQEPILNININED